MLDGIGFSIFIGTAFGFLTGLGTGGGSLLLLWLTLVLGMEPQQAKAINLMFFFPAAITASFLRLRKGGISYKKIILPALAGCIAAALFALAGRIIDIRHLKKAFGILLIITGVRELFYKNAATK